MQAQESTWDWIRLGCAFPQIPTLLPSHSYGLGISVRTELCCFPLGDSMASWSQGKTSVTKFKPRAKPQDPIEPVSCLGCCSCLAATVFSAGSNVPEDGRAWALTALAHADPLTAV